MKTMLLFLLFPLAYIAQTTTVGPKICFVTECIDFGEIEYASNGLFEYRFTNCGDEPLIIKNGQTSCGCLVCDYPKNPIAPGKSGVIKLRYDTQRVGPTNKSATITTNSREEPQKVIMLKGKVRFPAKAVFVDSTIDFGETSKNQQLSFDLKNRETYPSDYRKGDTVKILKIEEITKTGTKLVAEKQVLNKGESTHLVFSSGNRKGKFRKEWKVYIDDDRLPVVLIATGEVK